GAAEPVPPSTAARVGRSRTRVQRRRIEAETAPPLPCTAVSGHAPRLGELAGGAAEKDEADRRVHDHEGQMRRQAVAEERLLRDGPAEEVDPRQLARPEVRRRDRKRGEEEDDGEKGQ